MMKKSIVGIVGIALIAILVAVTACAAPKVSPPTTPAGDQPLPDGVYPGITGPLGQPGNFTYKGTITIPHLGDMTGPASASMPHVLAGLEQWARYQNEYLGGIRGYKMAWNTTDSKYEPELMINQMNRFVDEGNPFIYTMIAYIVPASGEVCQRRHIPYLGLSGQVTQAFLSPEAAKTRYNYHFQMSPVTASRMNIDLKFIMQDWAKKGQTRKPRIGTFNGDGQSGHEAATALRIYAEKMGAEFTVHTFHPANITDAIAQVSTLKRANVDYIVGGPDTDQPLSVFALEVERQQTPDWNPTIVSHTDFLSAYLNTKNVAFEGHYAYQYCLDWADEDVPVIKLAHTLNEMWNPEYKQRPFLYMAAVQSGIVVSELYKRVIDKHGTPKITGEQMREIMEGFNKYDPIGISGPLTWTVNDHQGSRSLRLSQCKDGKVVPATGWVEGDLFTPEQMDGKYWLKD